MGQATVADIDILIGKLDEGYKILVSRIGGYDDDYANKVADMVPTIHDMGHGPWARFYVDHIGFGCFVGRDGRGNKITFDGGGAMRRLEGVAWCPLTCEGPDLGNQDVFPYDVEFVRDVLVTLRNRIGE